MEKQDKLDALNEAYVKALASGKIHNRKQFAHFIGINPSTLSAAFNGNDTYLSESLVLRAKDAAEKIEMDEMFPSIRKAPGQEENTLVIPVGAMAGTLGDFAESVQAYDCERIISPIKGADYAIKVNGESMTPEYPNGSLILIKKIDPDVFIAWGNVFVLDTANGAVIKKVNQTSIDGVVECVSINPAFSPFKVKMADVFGWYRVLMVLAAK